MNAAEVFYKAAATILVEEGKRVSHAAVAREIGVHRIGFSRCVNGHNDVTVGRLQAWMRAWERAGHEPIELKVSGKKVRLERDRRGT